MSEESEIVKVKFHANGELTTTQDGVTSIIAKYDKKTRVLEFATKEYSVAYYTQVISKISTVNNGKQPSGNIIGSILVKGDSAAVPLPKNAPPRPKLGPLGDAAKDYVAWMIKYDLPQAIVRYGIYTDDNGEPVRKNVRRVFERIVDNRDMDAANIKPQGSAKSQTKGPVDEQVTAQEFEDAIIARRATALTFAPNEVLGGWNPEDAVYSNAESQD